ncbi:MAG: M6 family metalloprotease domain-containing protein [Bacteroidetes bacterium]|nr:M6 family metalloprotease domain-containing protein [Bacteroidota bacterium]
MIPKNFNSVMEIETISKNKTNQKSKNLKVLNFILICFFCVISFSSYGAYLTNVPITITQPDGTKIECFATGDEYYNWAHDADGYTIIQDQNTGYYCYAVLSGDELMASQHVVGTIAPQSVNLTPNTNISGEKILERRNAIIQHTSQNAARQNSSTPTRGATGTINNIVVYIRFADQTEFQTTQNAFTNVFNNISSGYNSMRNYFREVSYNQLDIITHFYPTNSGTTILSYQDSYNRDYYCEYSATNPIGYNGISEGLNREQILLKNAINYLKNQIPSSLNVDYNNDGDVDNVCLIMRGGASFSSLFWPHRSTLSLQNASINGKRVYNYNVQLESYTLYTENGYGNGLLCHEMNHTLGAPDLYHANDAMAPVGAWDLMEDETNPPQHMGAYMKYKYGGWISTIPSITISGTYTLNPLTSATNNCYKIPITGSSQYLVVEYRKKTGTFEAQLPGSGLIIYRINENYNGNYKYGAGAGGVSDEVYIFRPGGTLLLRGDIDNAYFSEASNRTTFGNSTNPSCFLSNGNLGNIHIKNIQENSNGTLSFDIRFCNVANPANVAYSNTSNLPALTSASNSIQTSGNVVVKSGDNVTFEAGDRVILNGIKIELGGGFKIEASGCE